MLEKDTHDHVDDTSSETDNLMRLKQLLDEWKMYYLERDEKENGHVRPNISVKRQHKKICCV